MTVSELRPDGKEMYVQSGWLRSSLRRLDASKSTELQPVLSLRRKHAEPLPQGEFAPIAVPLYYQGHAYRAGSRIRVTISAPGGDQPVWAFADTRPKTGTATVTFAHSPTQPARLVLPVVAGRRGVDRAAAVPRRARGALPLELLTDPPLRPISLTPWISKPCAPSSRPCWPRGNSHLRWATGAASGITRSTGRSASGSRTSRR